MVSIVIGGDICPMGSIENAFIEGKANEIFHDLLDEINSADLSIANLECPLVSEDTPIEKAGGTILGASIKCIQGFASTEWQVLNLANNHSFDHGVKGLRETIHTIERTGISAIGAGSNIEAAQKPFIKEINGERIVIYSMAEREYSIADEKTAGANPLDLINFVNAIRQHKQQGIFIVLIHGGKEFYPYPSPEMVRRCRFMVDMGADAVICCHTHCPLPWEIYAERPIVYGLGNLIFESIRAKQDSWHEGYLAKLIIKDQQIGLEVIPYYQSLVYSGVKKMNEEEMENFFRKMGRKNSEMKDNDFMKSRWLKYCRQQKNQYLAELFGYNRLMSKVRGLLLRMLHSKKEVYNALLLVQCETHREILNTIFKEERQNG